MTRFIRALFRADEKRFRIQDEYRKQVLRKIRDLVPLDDYLMHLKDSAVLKSEAAREPAARLQRGCVMLRQGLVEEGLADLEVALACPAIACLCLLDRRTRPASCPCATLPSRCAALHGR